MFKPYLFLVRDTVTLKHRLIKLQIDTLEPGITVEGKIIIRPEVLLCVPKQIKERYTFMTYISAEKLFEYASIEYRDEMKKRFDFDTVDSYVIYGNPCIICRPKIEGINKLPTYYLVLNSKAIEGKPFVFTFTTDIESFSSHYKNDCAEVFKSFIKVLGIKKEISEEVEYFVYDEQEAFINLLEFNIKNNIDYLKEGLKCKK